MIDSDLPAFVSALAQLAALKPGAKLTPEQYDSWWDAMRGSWTLDEFRAACVSLRDTVEFMPNPFHFAELRRATGLQAPEAWAIVRECARHGRALPEGTITAVYQAVAALGGLRAIGHTNTDQMQFLERRFAEHYETLRESQGAREALPQVTGHDGRRDRLQGPAKASDLLPRITRAQGGTS